MLITPEDIAKVAYYATEVFREAAGETKFTMWQDANVYYRDLFTFGVDLVLCNPEFTPADIHSAWRAEKYANGWSYSKTRNYDVKTHDCLTEYDKLTEADKMKFILFWHIVHAFIDTILLDVTKKEMWSQILEYYVKNS